MLMCKDSAVGTQQVPHVFLLCDSEICVIIMQWELGYKLICLATQSGRLKTNQLVNTDKILFPTHITIYVGKLLFITLI